MKRKKKHIAFLMGGLSSEREVSLNSGNACYDAIDKEKYYASKIIVNKNFYNQIKLSNNLTRLNVYIPVKLILIIFLMIEKLKLPLQFSSENILGIKNMKTFDTHKAMETLGLSLLDLEEALKKVSDS